MRTMTAAAAAMIAQESRVEQILLVTVLWNNGANGITYSDREFADMGFVGKLLNVGQFDDVINIDASSNSVSTSVTLDDTDGYLKQMIDSTDIHKTKVHITQWFVGLTVEDRFGLLVGEITSPIAWNEGDRTLTFNVTTKLQDVEAGFSIEEGDFATVPTSAIGKPWPLIFGTVGGVSALRIIDAPVGILGEGIGVVNQAAWLKEMRDLNQQLILADINRRDSYNLGYAAAIKAADLGWPITDLDGDGLEDVGPPIVTTRTVPNPNYDPDQPSILSTLNVAGHDYADPGEVGNTDYDPNNPEMIVTEVTERPARSVEPAEAAHQESERYYAQNAQYQLEVRRILQQIGRRLEEKAEQEHYNKTVFKVITKTIPQNRGIQFTLGGVRYTGQLNGEYFHASDRAIPVFSNGQTTYNNVNENPGIASAFYSKKSLIEDGQKFFWIDAGTEIKLTNLPLTYVASLGWPVITSVYGTRKGVRFRIPPSYYTIVRGQQAPNSQYVDLLKVTYLVFSRPLSSIIENDGSTWDSDDVEIDAIGEVGPNVVDILIHLILTYTEFFYDPVSFNHVRTLVANYPANFALIDRKNIMELLKEIAFQARCSISINDNQFYLRYLPETPTPVDTITEADLTLNTFSVESSPTDGIVTKLIAQWRALFNQSQPYKIIYKYNTQRYGISEQTYDFYIYNSSDLVEVAAQFWLIRKANNFKIVKFRTAIHKLKLETLDPVTIDLPQVASVPVIGIVQKATYDPDNYSIDFEVWVPVRFGEMTPYIFAYPKDLPPQYIYPLLNDPNIRTPNPFEGQSADIPNVDLAQATNQPTIDYTTRSQRGVGSAGRHQPIGDAHDHARKNPNEKVQAVLDQQDVINTRPDTLDKSNNKARWAVEPVTPVTPIPPQPGTFPGFVESHDDGKFYNVDIYFSGMSRSPKSRRVRQLAIRNDDKLPGGTPVMVSRIVAPDGSYEYVMQAPTYLDNLDEPA